MGYNSKSRGKLICRYGSGYVLCVLPSLPAPAAPQENPKDSRKDSRHNACSLGPFSPPATLLHNIPSIPLCPNEIYYIIQYIGPKKASQWRAPDIKDIFIKWNKIKPYVFMLTHVNISAILYINTR